MSKKRIVVAGVGNVFMQDDAFGVEVVKRLLDKGPREGVEIYDVGIGGLKLAYDLLRGYDGLIMIDASKRGGKPGTLYVIEPKEEEINSDLQQGGAIDPHGGDPAMVLRFVKALGAWPPKVLIVGCEPATVNDFEMGLSAPVSAAIDDAVKLVETTIEEIQNAS